MSRIYFHSESDDAEVRGSERAHAGCLIGNLTAAVLENDLRYGDGGELMKLILPPTCYLQGVPNASFASAFGTWLLVSYGDGEYFQIGEQRESPWRISLNTAAVLGGNPLKMMTRIHAQCEIHGYVMGPNRNWMAGIIETGLRDLLFRAGEGWESAVELLRRDDKSPVVMSYSVCEQFPNAGIAEWNGDEDEWYDLPDHRKWELGMEGLRKKGGKLEIRPDDWDRYGYGTGLSAFDIIAHLKTLTQAPPVG